MNCPKFVLVVMRIPAAWEHRPIGPQFSWKLWTDGCSGDKEGDGAAVGAVCACVGGRGTEPIPKATLNKGALLKWMWLYLFLLVHGLEGDQAVKERFKINWTDGTANLNEWMFFWSGWVYFASRLG